MYKSLFRIWLSVGFSSGRLSDAAILYVLQGGQAKSGRKFAEKTTVRGYKTSSKRYLTGILAAALLTGCAAVRSSEETSAETAPVTYAGTVECDKYSLSYPADMVFCQLGGSDGVLPNTVSYTDEDAEKDGTLNCIISADENYILMFAAQQYDTPFRMAWQHAECFLGDVHSCTFLGADGWYSAYNMNGISGIPARMVFIEKDGMTFAAEIAADSTDTLDTFMGISKNPRFSKFDNVFACFTNMKAAKR